METNWLVCHPSTSASAITHVNCGVELRRDDIWLTFVVGGGEKSLFLPSATKPYRADGLWATTCFEAFVRNADGTYFEFNFSPSLEWAAYSFSAYRCGMEELALDWPPRILTSHESGFYYVSILLPRLEWDGKAIALSAVIEETDGTKSYWALAHPPGKPDFHHPACFTATLPPPITP